MSYVRTLIQAIEPGSATIDLHLPHTLLRKWQIGTDLSIQFGNKITRARVVGTDASTKTWIGSSLLRPLYLPPGIPLLMRYNAAEKCITFGPYIGILVSGYDEQNGENPFGTFTPFFNEVADICGKRGIIACVFRLNDVDWVTETIRGLVRLNDKWECRTMPLPQCVYNRLTSRKKEKSDEVSEWIRRCKEARIPFFNEKFLNKWHVHKALEKDPSANSYLPITTVYNGQHDLKQILQKFHTVYVKPATGSMGRGIFRIRRTVNGYQLSSSSGDGDKTKIFQQFHSLYEHLNKRINGKAYLLQQGLVLIGLNQNPTDFRVLVQKNRTGTWGVTSLVARLGQNNVVSNIARGGSMISAAQALQLCGPWRTAQKPSQAALKHAALQLARMLEKGLDGHYAEFGIDLGIDVNGHIWLLEVNSKPSKSTDASKISVDSQDRPRPSVIRMLDYAAFLSGFPLARTVKAKVKPGKKQVKKKNRR